MQLPYAPFWSPLSPLAGAAIDHGVPRVSSNAGRPRPRTLAEFQAQIQAERRGKLSRALSRPVHYVALGASDAIGVGATVSNGSYVHRLAGRLQGYFGASRTVLLHNLGVTGYTLGDILQHELPEALTLSPDIVTLWAGGNDLVQGIDANDFVDQLRQVLTLLQRLDCQVFVASPPDLSLVPVIRNLPPWLMPLTGLQSYAQKRSQELLDAVLRLVPSMGATYVHLPFSELAADPSLVSADGFHPSDAGYERLAGAWWQVIARALS